MCRADVLCVCMCVFVSGSKGLLFNTRLSARTAPVMLTALTTPTHTHSTTPPGLSIFASRKRRHRRRREGEKKRRRRERQKRKSVTLYQAGESRTPRKTRHKQFKLNKQTWLIGLRLQARWRGRYALTLDTKIFTPYLLI